ncbi:uncharacterized protein CTRU02_205111 [Colletotrichum truncatum]|uniref:Uncharacterized protein n=1 Tax=Colletotrichum truncatum TaxID=5467 RepID=A0ACC3Z339_COLTU|nr:uncharacterized protein CTRU02_06059 [Colletotrichum truncatum]KAF6793187.1 hypothetical protein CTRU02_06059 [Colletotrichum truncatum]
MRLESNLGFLITAAFFGPVWGLPAESDATVPLATDPLAPIPEVQYIEFPVDRAPITDITDGSTEMALSVSDDEDPYTVSCTYGLWTYYYNWIPAVTSLCRDIKDSLEKGFRASWVNSDILIGEAKNFSLNWAKTGNNCKQTCQQVFNRLHTDPACRGEGFWIMEKGKITVKGCGEGNYHVNYDLEAPMLDHGTGLCWNTPVPPTYEPKSDVTRRFCVDAIEHVLRKGEEFTYPGERTGYYWTDYNREVGQPGKETVYYDVGFVHYWIKGTRMANVCRPGKEVADAVKEVNVEQCVRHITAAEKQACGAPTKKTFGGRIWADCFEWGVKASGYDGIKDKVDRTRFLAS